MIRRNATMQSLLRLSLNQTSKGKFFKDVSHHTLLSALSQLIEGRGWLVGEIHIGLSRDRGDMVAGIEVLSQDFPVPDDCTPCLAVVNSVVKRRKIRFMSGVMCEDTGVVLNGESFHLRHTKNLDLTQEIEDQLTLFEAQVKEFPYMIQELRDSSLSNSQASELLMECCRKYVIPWGRLSFADDIWYNMQGSNCWDLMLCVSKVIAKSPPVDTQGMRSQLDTLLMLKELVTSRVLSRR